MIIEDHSNQTDIVSNQKDMIDFEETTCNNKPITGETSFIKNNLNSTMKGEAGNSKRLKLDNKYSISREDDSSEQLIIV
jgi:hypothetical protein